MYYALFRYFFSIGAACRGPVNLKGRSCLTLKDFSSDEIKRLLWVSGDLKHRIKHEKQVANVMPTNVNGKLHVWRVLQPHLRELTCHFYFSIFLSYKESRLQWYLRRGAPEQECPQKQVSVLYKHLQWCQLNIPMHNRILQVGTFYVVNMQLLSVRFTLEMTFISYC